MAELTPEEAVLTYGGNTRFHEDSWKEGLETFRLKFGKQAVRQMALQFRVTEATARRWFAGKPPERMKATLAHQTARYPAQAAAIRMDSAVKHGPCTVNIDYSRGSTLRRIPEQRLDRFDEVQDYWDRSISALRVGDAFVGGEEFAAAIAAGYGLPEEIRIVSFETVPSLS